MVISAAQILENIAKSGIPDEPDDYERTELKYVYRPGRPAKGQHKICPCCGGKAGSSGFCRLAYERNRRAKRKKEQA